MAAADVLDECVPGGNYSCAAKLFEPAHRSQSGFQLSVIGFDRVVNRYERSSIASLVGLLRFGETLVSIRCDRAGQGRWE